MIGYDQWDLVSVVMQGPSAAQLAYFGRVEQGPAKAYDHALRLHMSLAVSVAVLLAVVAAVPELRPSGVGRTLRLFAAVALPSAAMAAAMHAVLVLWPAGPGWLPGLTTLTLASAAGFVVYLLIARLMLRRTTLLFRLLLADRWPWNRRLSRKPRFGGML